MLKKKSFLERLTGGIRFEDNDEEEEVSSEKPSKKINLSNRDNEAKELNLSKEAKWEEEIDAELTVDVYQTPSHIVIKAMIAGVRPEDLDVSITRDMVTIRGKREEERAQRAVPATPAATMPDEERARSAPSN